jgi:hypothetical protein
MNRKYSEEMVLVHQQPQKKQVLMPPYYVQWHNPLSGDTKYQVENPGHDMRELILQNL